MIQDGGSRQESCGAREAANVFQGFVNNQPVKRYIEGNETFHLHTAWDSTKKLAENRNLSKIYDVSNVSTGWETAYDQYYIGGVPMQLKPPAWL